MSLEGVDSEQRHVVLRSLPDKDETISEVVEVFWELANCELDEEND